VRDLPRQLELEQLVELFESDNPLTRALAGVEDPLGKAREVAQGLTHDEKVEVLAAHPAIGQRTGLSQRSAAEQGADADPEVLAELARLNAEYEERHGFRFVVFVDRRPKAEILEVLRGRIGNPTEQELDTALGELCAIAEDRWQRS
jgi:2-oxo-4-hydroxy-4-carboxy--5-ureidoimidazoline (OHCU) decarboxylase